MIFNYLTTGRKGQRSLREVKQSELYNCPRLLPGDFPGCSAEKGNPNRTRGLSE